MSMDAKLKVENDTLVISVPMKAERSNPWDEAYSAPMPNIIGLVVSDNDMGLCYRIDMEYKGKDDQWTDYFYKWPSGELKEFEQFCATNKIDIVYSPR